MAKNDNSLEIIKKALLKKAQGFYADEIIEEYVVDENGKEKLQKKKVTKKYVPADLSASKLLLDYYNERPENYENMSDEELDKQAEKLYEEYKKMQTQFNTTATDGWYASQMMTDDWYPLKQSFGVLIIQSNKFCNI